MTIDPDSFRSVLGRFASGITVVTTRDADGRDLGMTVSAFCSASLHPPLVQVCVDHAASLHGALAGSTHYGVSILAAEQEALSRRFAEANSTRRFDGIGYRRGESGVILLDDALAHLECRIVAAHETGDHTMFVGEVESATARSARPLLYYRGGYAQLER
ncbi:MAG TPA: flavin reductase family protein [Gemmatimonadaceae bacterium]|jgi:flavin reductase (DIM6/NTAB) family NADH-FMN oxidoreductase RutF|nr:flavin reductase family protein [Gemmatimonadaceae bacterium]